MALTDADRLQMTALALMRHSVMAGGSGGGDFYSLVFIFEDLGLMGVPSAFSP